MERQAHALVQDADDANEVMQYPIDNHVRANRIDAVRLGQIGVTVPGVRVQANGFKRRVNQVAVNKDLGLSPVFARIAKDEREVPARARR